MIRLVRRVASCTRNPNRPAGLYLEMYHGRDQAMEDMSEWGYDGPIIGPLKFVHTTYGSIVHIEFDDTETAQRNGFDHVYQMFDIVDGGCLVCNGKYYGDWTVQYNVATELSMP